MTNILAKWDGPVGLMNAQSEWGLESWVFPSSNLGTFDSTTVQPNPFNLQSNKKYIKYGILFSKEEIAATIGERPATLVGIGFFCKEKPYCSLVDYEIKVGNTQLNTLQSGWGETEKNLVKVSFLPLSGKWFFFGPFSQNPEEAFVWDGTSNLYFELSWSRQRGKTSTGRSSLVASTPSDFQKTLMTSAGADDIMENMPFIWGAPRPATILKWKI